MTCKDSHFLIGLGIGSIFGALAYGFARSARAKKMKAEVFDALHRIEGHKPVDRKSTRLNSSHRT